MPVVALGVLGWQQRWTAEDAFIDFRVVDNLLHGHGPVFNTGERVEAYTSALWVAVIGAADAVLPARIEWISVVFGLILSMAGLAAASWGAVMLARRRGNAGVAVPLGALVFVAVAPAWDFATSGLESGLETGWLGISFLCMVRVQRDAPVSRRECLLVAMLVGLGPLVRPDFLIFTVAFVAVLVVTGGRSARRGFGLVAAAAALPLAYEIFRMGYFASLVPNTAFAKEAGRSYWSQGLRYLWDFVQPYALYLPVAGLLLGIVWQVRDDVRRGRSHAAMLVIATLGASFLEGLFVVRVGGDFMHGRMLLPVLFALLMPVMAVPLPARTRHIASGLAVVAWALLCAVALRAPYAGNTVLHPNQRIIDERAYYVGQTGGVSHPVALGDYGATIWVRVGEAARTRAASGDHAVSFVAVPRWLYGRLPRELPARSSSEQPFVLPAGNVGLLGYAAGSRVRVVDLLGLADPIGARIELTHRGRPGHEKLLPVEWVTGRFAAVGRAGKPDRVSAARVALRCGDLARYLKAIEAPMSAARFLSNIGTAIQTYSLRYPGDPVAARQRLCGG